MKKTNDKFIAILSIILGILIFIRPELLSWIIALFLIVWGVTRLI